MSIRNSAKKLPYPIKQGIKYAYGLIPFSIRYGKVFRDTYEFLQKSQWWSREKLEEYQMQQLAKLLTHSYENIPYYRRVFDERGLKPTRLFLTCKLAYAFFISSAPSTFTKRSFGSKKCLTNYFHYICT